MNKWYRINAKQFENVKNMWKTIECHKICRIIERRQIPFEIYCANSKTIE